MPNEPKALIAHVVSNDRSVKFFDLLKVGKNPRIEIQICELGNHGTVVTERVTHRCAAAEIKLICHDIVARRNDIAWTDGTINFLSQSKHSMPYMISLRKPTGAFTPVQIRMSEHDARLLAIMVLDWIRAWEFNNFASRRDAAMVITYSPTSGDESVAETQTDRMTKLPDWQRPKSSSPGLALVLAGAKS